MYKIKYNLIFDNNNVGEQIAINDFHFRNIEIPLERYSKTFDSPDIGK